MRKFTVESPITYCFASKLNPIIKIDSKRNITIHQTVREKLEAFETRKKSDKFLITWGGQWRSDVFEISEADIKLVLANNWK